MEKCLFVYNPNSGKGKIAKKENYIVSRLKEKYDVEIARSQYAGNMGDIIRQRGEEFDLIVVGGGDGSFNEIVDAVMSLEKRVKIGYIPSGTVNDIAHSLYIPRKIKKAVDNILSGQTFSHDVMKINDKFGIYVCCSGIFTDTSYSTDQSKKKKMGKLAYAFYGIKKIFSTPAINLNLIYKDGKIEGKFAIMLIINSRYVSSFALNKHTNLNDGLVDVVLVESQKDIVNLKAVWRVFKLFLFGVKKRKGTYYLPLDKFSLKTTQETNINVDGEKIGRGSFEFQVIKGGVDIIVPKKHKLTK